MSKETLLNRQFTEREVQRMRNIVMDKHGDKTRSQIGYENTQQHIEGDTWEENGKTWTIKNGIKRSMPKLSSFKQAYHMPLICPACKTHLDHKSELTKHMYKLFYKCPKCVAELETQLKLDGKFEEYAKNQRKSNMLSILDNMEVEFDDFIKHGFEKHMSEEGEVENWDGNSLSIEQIKEVKDWIKTRKEQL
jgi:hypothetical protein